MNIYDLVIESDFQIRVIMLKTDLLPYDNVADLFIIDPDGFIIRKWNSKQLNNGLMTAEFQVKIHILSLCMLFTCSS